MGAQSRSYLHGVPKVSTFTHHNKLTSRIVSKPLMGLTVRATRAEHSRRFLSLDYVIKYVTTHLQEIPQRIR